MDDFFGNVRFVSRLGVYDIDRNTFESFNEFLYKVISDYSPNCDNLLKQPQYWLEFDNEPTNPNPNQENNENKDIISNTAIDCTNFITELLKEQDQFDSANSLPSSPKLGKREKHSYTIPHQDNFNAIQNNWLFNDKKSLKQTSQSVPLHTLVIKLFERKWMTISDFVVYHKYKSKGYKLNKGDMFGFNYLVYKDDWADHSFLALQFFGEEKKAYQVIQSTRISHNYNKDLSLVNFYYESERVECRKLDFLFEKKVMDLWQKDGVDVMGDIGKWVENIVVEELIFSRVKSIKDF